MKKYIKYTKRIIALLTVVLLNVNTFATTASNDGSAFITKADFDELVTDFNAKMNEYQSALNAKIDYAVANYIAGMSVISTQEIKTGIDLECVNGAKLRFIRKDMNYLGMNNEIYGRDYIFNVACGTYQPIAVYEHDCYDTLIFTGNHVHGNTTNYLYMLDGNDCIDTRRQNCRIVAQRLYIFYSTTDAQHGLNWNNISQSLNTPTSVYSSTSAYINTTDAKARAYRQLDESATTSAAPWTEKAICIARYRNDYNRTTHVTSNPKEFNNHVWGTPASHVQNLTNVAQQTVVSITGNEQRGFVDHWQNGSDNAIKTCSAEWGSDGMIAANSTSRTGYTNVKEIRATSGPGCYRVTSMVPTVYGYGVKINHGTKAPTAVYYKNIYANWENKKLSAGGGFPFLWHKKDGTVTVSLTLSTAATLCFTTAQNTTFPSAGDTNLVTFEYQPAGEEFIQTTAPVLLGAGTYTFKVPVLNARPVFLCADWETTADYLIIEQEGNAKIAFNS